MTKLNKVILSIVLMLFVLCIYQSVYTFGVFIFYVYPELNTLENQYMQLINTNVFYWKDFMIALMLSYLFYFKGMQQVKADSRRKRNSIITGKVVSLNITK